MNSVLDFENPDEIVRKIYKERHGNRGPFDYSPGLTLQEARLNPRYTSITHNEVDLSTKIGDVTLNLPILSAAMDFVADHRLSIKLMEFGACGIIHYGFKDKGDQIKEAAKVINHIPCFVEDPMTLHPHSLIGDADYIYQNHRYNTIPVVSEKNELLGILFAKYVVPMKETHSDPVVKWMKPFDELTTMHINQPFEKIREILTTKRQCTILPRINDDRILKGINFRKDFVYANPVLFEGKPLVGIAVGVQDEDVERAKKAMQIGVGIIVIDSSHGNSLKVLEQVQKIVSAKKSVGTSCAIIAGNLSRDMHGYRNFSLVGADGAKLGIGPGSTCTTSLKVGVTSAMFSTIQDIRFIKRRMNELGLSTPDIIADGGMRESGDIAIALAAGADSVMLGNMLVGAKESISANNGAGVKEIDGKKCVEYRGMGSREAIQKRTALVRYDCKIAPEGECGYAEYRGPLRDWFPEVIESIKKALSHINARNIKQLHEYGDLGSAAFEYFTPFGQQQMNPSIKPK